MAGMTVVVSHCALKGYLPEMLGNGFGQMGVGIFYALSGFLMAHVCFEIPLNFGSLRDYAVARGSRVLPLFYIVALANAALLLLVGIDPYEMHNLERVARNLLLLRGDTVLWSIPVEIQFYAVFAGIWWARQKGKSALVIAGLGFLGLLAIVLKLTGLVHTSEYLLPYWLHFFLIGVLMHLFLGQHYDSLRQKTSGALGLWIGALTVLLLFCLPPQLRVDAGLPAFPTFADPVLIVAVPLLLLCCVLQVRPLAFLGHPIMRWYGKISFSLYLLHWPLLKLSKSIDIERFVHPFGAFVVLAASATLLAAISQKVLERPIMLALRKALIKPAPLANAAGLARQS